MPTVDVGVQYDDFKGGVAADDADSQGLRDLLQEKGLIGPNEAIEGLSFYSGDTFPGEELRPQVHVYLLDISGYSDRPSASRAEPDKPLREVDLDLSLSEFFALFKRFNIVLESRSGRVIGREYIEAGG